MASQSTYLRYMRLLQMWPVDTSKEGLDLGRHLRNRVADAFRQGEMSPIPDEVRCRRMHDSLLRIATDYYAQRYVRSNRTLGATGVSAEMCRTIVSADAMQEYRRKEKSLVGRLKDKLGILSSRNV